MRISFKKLKKIAETYGYSVIKHEMLGNRKKEYYIYSIIDGKNTIIENESIKKIFNYLLEKKHGISFD